MPKRQRRTLYPDSVYSRRNLERWLQDDLATKASHRHRIWKHLHVATADGDNTTSNNDNKTIHSVPDLPQIVKDCFEKNFVLTTSRVVEEKTSPHGRKLVIQLQDHHLIETVIIQHTHDRSTVCVSSQIGCQMGCTFCATGTLGKIANLTDAEIVEQVHHARERDPNVTGVVFMGMGEPLDNYANVLEAIQSLAEPSVLNGNPIPLRRITLSTVGVVHGIAKLTKDCPQIQLALSLHAPNDQIRQRIVPTAKAFSISKIMTAIDEYQTAAGRSVMIEYIMIANVNSSMQCAHELGALLQGRKCMVNLIPYNPTEAGERYDFKAPSDRVLQEFAKILYEYRDDKNKPLRCSIRWSSQRGQDIDAACGQLALKNVRFSSSNSRRGTAASSRKAVSGDIEDFGTNNKCVGAKSVRLPFKRKVGSNRGKVMKRREMPKYWWHAVFVGSLLLGGALFLRRKRS